MDLEKFRNYKSLIDSIYEKELSASFLWYEGNKENVLTGKIEDRWDDFIIIADADKAICLNRNAIIRIKLV